MRKYLEFLKELDPAFKKNALFIFLSYFLVLFSYPPARSVAQSLFYEHHTAQDYSFATFISVLALVGAIFISNKIQEKIGAQKLFAIIGAVSIGGLAGSYFFLNKGHSSAAFYLFAVKETYIVLLIHLLLAYANANFTLEQIKRLYGPLGAMGSIGGIIGGQLTSYFSDNTGVEAAFALGLLGIGLAVASFFFTERLVLNQKERGELSPLNSIKDVKKYVFLIAGVVALSQWVIFIADLQFNMLFEKAFETKDARTSYLGNLYSLINVFTLFVQFVVLPWLLVKISVKKIFFAVPLFYLLLIFGGVGMGAGALGVSAFVFISLKGTDYSVFSVAKEVMYYPLDKLQRFGAKYVTDMFVYRLAKALIAFVMAQYLLENIAKDMAYLNLLQAAFISLWLCLLVLLFREQKRVNKQASENL
ncbi:MAG: MFS transporter [Bacteriovoracaceae bacterium]